MAALGESRRLPAQGPHIPLRESAREATREGFQAIRPGSNHVAWVLAISHERLFDHTEAAGGAGHECKPVVVHEGSPRYGKRELDQGPVDQGRTSGNGILDQQSRKARASGIEARIAPERRMPLAKHFVDDGEIAVHQEGSVGAVLALRLPQPAGQSARLLRYRPLLLVAPAACRSLCLLDKAG